MIGVILVHVLAVTMAVTLKYHYSTATAAELAWILEPTARLVNQVTGAGFVFKDEVGFVSADSRFIIAPSCSGINFMIICFVMLVFGHLRQLRKPARQLMFLAVAALGTYVTTLAVNTVRIYLSIYTFSSESYFELLSRDSMHRLEGIAIYFSALMLVHHLAAALFRRPQFSETDGRQSGFSPIKGGITLLAPLFWYLLVTLGIPMFRMSYREGFEEFIEHSLYVLILPALITVGFILLKRCACRIVWRKGVENAH